MMKTLWLQRGEGKWVTLGRWLASSTPIWEKEIMMKTKEIHFIEIVTNMYVSLFPSTDDSDEGIWLVLQKNVSQLNLWMRWIAKVHLWNANRFMSTNFKKLQISKKYCIGISHGVPPSLSKLSSRCFFLLFKNFVTKRKVNRYTETNTQTNTDTNTKTNERQIQGQIHRQISKLYSRCFFLRVKKLVTVCHPARP